MGEQEYKDEDIRYYESMPDVHGSFCKLAFESDLPVLTALLQLFSGSPPAVYEK